MARVPPAVSALILLTHSTFSTAQAQTSEERPPPGDLGAVQQAIASSLRSPLFKTDDELTPRTRIGEGRFGRSVDVDGDFAVVGAPCEDCPDGRSGAAHVFVRHGPSDPMARSTHLAIDGHGYFILRVGNAHFYTRDGDFHFDEEGFLVRRVGERVRGQILDISGIRLGSGAISLHLSAYPPRATSDGISGLGVELHVNLDAREEVGVSFDPTSFQTADMTSDFSTSVEVFDSLGGGHETFIYFRKAEQGGEESRGEWEWYGVVDGREVEGGNEGVPFVGAEGILIFDGEGRLSDQDELRSSFDFVGGARPDQHIGFRFGDDLARGGTGLAGSTSLVSESIVIAQRQDGFAPYWEPDAFGNLAEATFGEFAGSANGGEISSPRDGDAAIDVPALSFLAGGAAPDGAFTTRVDVSVNLDSREQAGPPFDPSSFETARLTSTFSLRAPVFDSAGGRHEVTIYFRKAAIGQLGSPSEWKWFAVVDGSEVEEGIPGAPSVRADGFLRFDSGGGLIEAAVLFSSFDFVGDAAPGQIVEFNFAGSCSFAFITFDKSSIRIPGLRIERDGLVIQVAPDGREVAIGQIELATFRNVEGLVDLGDGLWGGSLESGIPLIGRPDRGGFGSIFAFPEKSVGWSHGQTLVPIQESSDARFGASVAIEGGTLVVGAPGSGDPGGVAGEATVYAHRAGRWEAIQKLTAESPSSTDLFGQAVAIDGDTIVIGSPGEGDGGAVHVFVHEGNDWVRRAALSPLEAARGESFGHSVAFDGERILVGAPDNDGSGSGSAYVFTGGGGTWVQMPKLTAEDPGAGDSFGTAVALDGDVAMVGAPLADSDAVDSGAVYVFNRVRFSWKQQAKLGLKESQGFEFFGSAVALGNGKAVVGAPNHERIGASGSDFRSGAVFVYYLQGDQWEPRGELDPSGSVELVGLGSAVAMGDRTALVGAPLSYFSSGTPGAAFAFDQLPSEIIEIGFEAGDMGWVAHNFSGEGMIEHQDGNGLCIFVPETGENVLEWRAPESQAIDLIKNHVYRVRFTMSSDQYYMSEAQPIWQIVYGNRFDSKGILTWGGERWFYSAAGYANSIGSGVIHGFNEFDAWIAPLAVGTQQWNGDIDFEDSAFSPLNAPFNGLNVGFRVMDLDSAGGGALGSENDFGLTCLQAVRVDAIPIADLIASEPRSMGIGGQLGVDLEVIYSTENTIIERKGGSISIHLGEPGGMGRAFIGVDHVGDLRNLRVDGNGYFVLRDDDDSIFFAREGPFHMNNEGFVTHWTGSWLQGSVFDLAGMDLGVDRLQLGKVNAPPRATGPGPNGSGVEIGLNLDSREQVVAPEPLGFDSSSFASAEQTSNYSTRLDVFDSKGVGHALTIYFRRAETDPSSPSQIVWEWFAVVDGSEVELGARGLPDVGASGVLIFNATGELEEEQLLFSDFDFTGGVHQNQEIGFRFGEDPSTKGVGATRTTSLPERYFVAHQRQDGFAAGTLSDFKIGRDGLIQGLFTNGETIPVGRIALARFPEESPPEPIGDGIYVATEQSGEPVLLAPGDPGMGTIGSSAGPLRRMFPIPWRDHQLLRAETEIIDPRPASGSNPVDVISIGWQAATNEIGGVDYISRGQRGGVFDRSGSPRSLADTGGIAQTFTSFFYSHHATDVDPLLFPDARRLRAILDFFNRDDIAGELGEGEFSDPFEIRSFTVEPILMPLDYDLPAS